jgi:peroxiredoxin
MQQVVDLQRDKAFEDLGVQLLAISPDPVSAWQQGGSMGITVPTLSDPGNTVWMKYGTQGWMMATNEPGHTFFLVGPDGKIAWLRDYGAPEHGGAMYVEPDEIVSQVQQALSGS